MLQTRNVGNPVRRGIGALLIALAAVVTVVGVAPPAHADWRDRERERHERERWRWHHEHPYGYAPPPVVYAPPVVAAPSLNFVFPLHIR